MDILEASIYENINMPMFTVPRNFLILFTVPRNFLILLTNNLQGGP